MAGLGAKLFSSGTALAAADVNGYLADQAVMVFADATARDAAFGGAGEPVVAEGMVCYLKNPDHLQIYTGSAWKTVAYSGSTNGTVLQTVVGTTATATSNSTSTYADTTLTATITPTSTASKVLVYAVQTGASKTANTSMGMRLLRGATALTLALSNFDTGSTLLNSGTVTMMWLDSPATTSATTYKTQFASTANVASVTVQGSSLSTSVIILQEIAV